MSFKKTLTLPEKLYYQLLHEAEVRGISFNRYLVLKLSSAEPVVYIDLQGVCRALADIRNCLDKWSENDKMRLEIEELCRFCESLLMQGLKRLQD